MDINCSLGRISNKSAKYSNNKKNIDISSYRLTTVCNAKNCGSPQEIIQEINSRKNFDYYSFIIRDEMSCGSGGGTDQISYDWFLIPSNYILFIYLIIKTW
jgi:sulfatase maturation enzyme AslB (radical SAM superfamily)